MMKKVFCFMLKALFVLEIVKFCPGFFSHVRKLVIVTKRQKR